MKTYVDSVALQAFCAGVMTMTLFLILLGKLTVEGPILAFALFFLIHIVWCFYWMRYFRNKALNN